MSDTRNERVFGRNEILFRNLNLALRDLDYDIKDSVVGCLDTHDSWKRLKAVMEDDPKLMEVIPTGRLHLDDSESKTRQLIGYMARAGKKVNYLVYILKKMGHYQALLAFGIVNEDVPVTRAPGGAGRHLGIGAPAGAGPHPGRGAPGGAGRHMGIGALGGAGPHPGRGAPGGAGRYLGIGALGGAGPHPGRRSQLTTPPLCLNADITIASSYAGYHARIVQQPQHSTYVSYCDQLKLSVVASGAESYLWHHKQSRDADWSPLNDFKWNELIIDEASFEHGGWYCCQVSSHCDSVRTVPVRVYVGTDVRDGGQDISIVRQPNSQQADIGAPCQFVCHAVGPDGSNNLFYQWIHYPRAPRGGRDIHGANAPVLCVDAITERHWGEYQCEVRHTSGIRILSDLAKLSEYEKAEIIYTAVDKVALLLGNFRYRHESELPAVEFDLIDLKQMLTMMGYKVISAANTTAPEMRRLLNYFYNMISPGVYALVYLAGHGEERNGRTYLKGYDCPLNDTSSDYCISVQKIIEGLQQHQAALLGVFVDLCRGEQRCRQTAGDFTQSQIVYKASNNLVVLYATSPGMNAYEELVSDEDKGDDGEMAVNKPMSIFADCLKSCLAKQIPLKTLCDKVIELCCARMTRLYEERMNEERMNEERMNEERMNEERVNGERINEDAKHEDAKREDAKREEQVPTYSCDMSENRSLMDDVIVTGNTAVTARNSMLWYQATGLGTICRQFEGEFKMEEVGITASVYYQSTISNMLEIVVETRLPCDWYVVATLNLMGLNVIYRKPQSLIGRTRCRTQVQDLQKLQDDMMITFVARHNTESRDVARHNTESRDAGPRRILNIGKPLLAGLELLLRRPDDVMTT